MRVDTKMWKLVKEFYIRFPNLLNNSGNNAFMLIFH